jgi:hypothetical protein
MAAANSSSSRVPFENALGRKVWLGGTSAGSSGGCLFSTDFDAGNLWREDLAKEEVVASRSDFSTAPSPLGPWSRGVAPWPPRAAAAVVSVAQGTRAIVAGGMGFAAGQPISGSGLGDVWSVSAAVCLLDAATGLVCGGNGAPDLALVRCVCSGGYSGPTCGVAPTPAPAPSAAGAGGGAASPAAVAVGVLVGAPLCGLAVCSLVAARYLRRNPGRPADEALPASLRAGGYARAALESAPGRAALALADAALGLAGAIAGGGSAGSGGGGVSPAGTAARARAASASALVEEGGGVSARLLTLERARDSPPKHTAGGTFARTEAGTAPASPVFRK